MLNIILNWYIDRLPFYVLIFTAITLIICRLWYHQKKGVCVCKTQLNGKVALVTGGTSGLGLETARDLAKRGAHVVVASIDVPYKEAVDDIINTSNNKKVEYMYLDLSKFSSIKQFAEKFTKKFDRLDILVNNAGCNGLKHKLSEDGIEMMMQINYLGPFLLTNLLLERMKSSKPSRIINVSSYAHRFANLDVNDLAQVRSSIFFKKYANSKLCVILWTKALAEKLPEGITANVVHPGLSKTNIFRRMNPIIRFFFLLIVRIVFKTAKEGAQTSIHLSVAPELEKVTGGYFSDCELRELKIPDEDTLVDAVWKKSALLTKSDLVI